MWNILQVRGCQCEISPMACWKVHKEIEKHRIYLCKYHRRWEQKRWKLKEASHRDPKPHKCKRRCTRKLIIFLKFFQQLPGFSGPRPLRGLRFTFAPLKCDHVMQFWTTQIRAIKVVWYRTERTYYLPIFKIMAKFPSVKAQLEPSIPVPYCQYILAKVFSISEVDCRFLLSGSLRTPSFTRRYFSFYPRPNSRLSLPPAT